jgi:predicted unusual protein kinase regulating ubiquinone biosynthesis (AarF/ABC1/UbiB family)
MTRSAKAPRTGALARGTITSVAAARLGLARLGERMRPAGADAAAEADAQARHEAAMGRILFQAMGQLRGTALKVSQILSMDSSFLPEGVRRELARACHQATPLNRALVGRVFRQSFGQEPEALFTRFEPQAFAAASLGQVHRAELAGHGPVAVKVQYPGIATTIASDMRLLRTTLRALAHSDLPLPGDVVVERVLEEIERTLLHEVDYLHEARQLQWFAEHAALPGIVLPQPIASHSRAQVLTQQYLHGLHLADWLRTDPTQAQRNQAGQWLWDWFMHCTFDLGHMHADLHPGNFLFLPDGQLGVLDFGCTRQLSPAFRSGVLQAWRALLQPASPARDQGVQQAYGALGLVDASLDLATFTGELMPALSIMQAWQTEPFTAPVFDFAGKSRPPAPVAAQQKVLARHLAAVPPELPSFERAWLGLMHLLTEMQAQVHTRAERWIG